MFDSFDQQTRNHKKPIWPSLTQQQNPHNSQPSSEGTVMQAILFKLMRLEHQVWAFGRGGREAVVSTKPKRDQ